MKFILLSWILWNGLPQDTVTKINDGKVYTIVNGTCVDSVKWIDFMDSLEMMPKGQREYTIDKMYEKAKPE